MWVFKFMLTHDCLYTRKCVKYNLTDYSFPAGYFVEGKHVYFSMMHVLRGREQDKNKFFAAMKADKKIEKVERQGNIIFTLAKETLKSGYYTPFYEPEFYFLKPVIMKPDGYEHWEVMCWDKKYFKRLIDIMKEKSKVDEFKILKLEKVKEKDIIFPALMPDFSGKQKEVLELAYKMGYYRVPKKTDLSRIAEKLDISKQTAQKHLKKAEAKLIPFLLERTNP